MFCPVQFIMEWIFLGISSMVMKERRQRRLPLFGVATVYPGGVSSEVSFTGLIQNISLSGVGLYMHRPVEVGTSVTVIVKFTGTGGKRKSDILEGTVASLTELESYYCVGVGFPRYLHKEDNPVLFSHLREIAPREI